MEDVEPLPLLIGRRIGERRSQLSLSLDEVASRAGVSRAMVSRIERGEVHASAVVLDRLCAGLGISLSALFARENTSPLLRRDEQPVWQDPSSLYVRREVAPSGTGSPVKIVEVEFPAGAEVVFERIPHRIVEQHLWVLAGSMEIALPSGTWQLGQGDCLHMRPADGITFRNRGAEPARYAVILTLEQLP